MKLSGKINKFIIQALTSLIFDTKNRKRIRNKLFEKWVGAIIVDPNSLEKYGNDLNFENIFQNNHQIISKPMDIIVPVYNGYKYLDDLFKSILDNTDLQYTLIVVDDCSSDKNVYPKLLEWKEKFEDKMQLFSNDENIGFLKTVNFAFSKTINDVVILNTDVIVPKNWASRLMYPVFENPKVASVTPFSNAATIFSFPKMWEDNELEHDFQEIDDVLAQIHFSHDETLNFATGVGFCMAMSRNALNSIGGFDEIFGKGYSEENDWCMRAIQEGFLNTVAPNLFVWHKHGGSFPSEEKKKLCENNHRILMQRHPQYVELVNSTINQKTYHSIRFLASLIYYNTFAEKTFLFFDHCFGGGTDVYFNNVSTELKQENLVLRFQYFYNTENYKLTFYYKKIQFFITDPDLNNLVCLLSQLKLDEIVVNNLVGYKDSLEILKIIESLKKEGVKISGRGHDFQGICPYYTLFSYARKYCDAPSDGFCDKCFSENYFNIKDENKKMVNVFKSGAIDISTWRKAWGYFYKNTVDEFIVFSESTKNIFAGVYPDLVEKMVLRPHFVKPLRQVVLKDTQKINIGVLGCINSEQKGCLVLNKIEELLVNKKDVNLVIIGNYKKKSSKTKVLGKYKIDDLPDIVEKNNINIIFIPSVWPETFSYVTSEAMNMGMPVACFDIGAPVERVQKYDKGLVIDKIDAEVALENIIEFVRNLKF